MAIPKGVSLKEVADKAGVSTATVSRVINSKTVVKGETELRVQKVIKQLGYRPNRVAQRLRTTNGASKLIGLLIPDIQNPFYVDVIRGIEQYAYARNFAIVIGNFSQNEERQKFYIDILKSESVDAFIVAPFPGMNDYVKELVEEGYAVVCIDRGLSNMDLDVVKVDNYQGAFDAVEHLVKVGHRRIGFISGNMQIPTTLERVSGYEAALTKNGIAIDREIIVGRNSDHTSGVELTAQLLDLPHPPTAIFTSNNLLTLGALETIHSRGLKIPEEIAILGFDDMYWSTSLNPPLTAVRQSGFEIGRITIDLLYQRIMEPARPYVSIVLKTELMVRTSCGHKSGKMKSTI
ncbi:HTH-type transcriptional repressor CytR [Dyadobacter sp. CECT 9275]|uniref:HTH-type transcriptional repressor CytR n=1 Tax=Dyadobacter helix TaxID=2822344 RepID=A0A916N7I3_9BACT|nr:LacI family DNA-binding transcriptional regulator [Dyadobacter sp. CECT 9275]CAG5016965.1 HTH-type transcriptional repressor CytR [Dyadobacter sp. CECT 9275]